MPFMKAQIQRIHFAESEEKHEENEPRQSGLERQKQFVSQNADEHREPESVGIKLTFDIGDW